MRGGLVGVGIGSPIGNGSDRDVAMMGNDKRKKHDQPIPGQQLEFRTKSGVLVVVTQPVDPSLYVGQKVIVRGNGESARVTWQ